MIQANPIAVAFAPSVGETTPCPKVRHAHVPCVYHAPSDQRSDAATYIRLHSLQCDWTNNGHGRELASNGSALNDPLCHWPQA